MTSDLTAPPRREFQSFHDFPIVTDLDNLDADIAILGIPFGDPYSMSEASNDQCPNAYPAVLRARPSWA